MEELEYYWLSKAFADVMTQIVADQDAEVPHPNTWQERYSYQGEKVFYAPMIVKSCYNVNTGEWVRVTFPSLQMYQAYFCIRNNSPRPCQILVKDQEMGPLAEYTGLDAVEYIKYWYLKEWPNSFKNCTKCEIKSVY